MSREQPEAVAHLRVLALALEDQGGDDAPARHDHAIVEVHTKVGISGLRLAFTVDELDLARQALGPDPA